MALILCFGATSPRLYAEEPELASVKQLIQENKFEQANKLLDEVLGKNPKSVNALMYKGNIIFYQASNANGIQLYGNSEENIYNSDIGSIGPGSSTISREAGQAIAKYFLRALAINPDRMDIQLGLCWTYANAGMTDELISRFPILKKRAGRDGIQYNMGDYARVVLNDHSFDDGIRVYREVMRLYPQDGNIVNDVGGMYFTHGRLKESLPYFEKAGKSNQADSKTFQNLVLIFSITGDYDRAQKYFDRLSAKEKKAGNVLYRGLVKHLRGDKTWVSDIRKYAASPSAEHKDFAGTLIALDKKPDYKTFEATLKPRIDTYYLIVHDNWATKQFPDQFEVMYQFGDLMTYYNNHEKAIAYYDRAKPSNPTQMDNLYFNKAWSLYQLGRENQANNLWKKLLDSDNYYQKSAAAYFLGNYHYKRKEYSQAKAYFARVKDGASKSKYANFCSNLYDEIEESKGSD